MMTTANSLSAVSFPTDLTTNPTWDPTVPSVHCPPISIPDTDNIIAELSMFASTIHTPIPTIPNPDNATSLCSDDSDLAIFRTAPTPSLKRRFNADMPAAKKQKFTKIEHTLATEPVTPSSRTKTTSIMGVPKIHVAPMSPPCQSLCTDEADDQPSMPPTPIPVDFSSLPSYTKEQTAKRRALRKAVMKRNRSRKEEGRPSVKSEPVSRSESEGSTGEPIDKKAARAIRNREAAMKSRVEAKQKMKKLQDENESLHVKVKTLSEEKEALTAQLKSLLQHTIGVHVNEGQDVKEMFNMFAPVGARA